MNDRVAVFEQHRPRLYGIAYRMLGTRADAEDIVQEAYLRWHRADIERLRAPEAWLVTATTRLCIAPLRAARTEREACVRPLLPRASAFIRCAVGATRLAPGWGPKVQ
jgi:RNA polymerase sigma-70 factor (ECF subfamily)